MNTDTLNDETANYIKELGGPYPQAYDKIMNSVCGMIADELSLDPLDVANLIRVSMARTQLDAMNLYPTSKDKKSADPELTTNTMIMCVAALSMAQHVIKDLRKQMKRDRPGLYEKLGQAQSETIILASASESIYRRMNDITKLIPHMIAHYITELTNELERAQS